MCDYSLHDVQSRPAQVGDKLIISNFRNSITRGLAAVGEPNMAVCLLPGAEIAFDRKVEADPIIPFLRLLVVPAYLRRAALASSPPNKDWGSPAPKGTIEPIPIAASEPVEPSKGSRS